MTTADVNPTGLDLVVGDNVRWTDGRTKQFEAGRVIGFDHGHVVAPIPLTGIGQAN